MDRLTIPPRLRPWVRLLVFAIAATALATTLAHVSVARVVEGLRVTRLALLFGLGIPLLASTFVLRTLRFRALLRAQGDRRAPFLEVLRAVVLSHGANNVLPLRAGELIRTREMVARGSSFGTVARAQIAEKLVELATLLAWSVPGIGLFFPRDLPLVLALEGALLFAALVWASAKILCAPDQVGVAERVHRVLAMAAAFAWSLLADGIEVALIAVCIASVDLNPSLTTCAAVLASTNLAIALPSTPGQLGTFEAGASIGLVLAGAPGALALGFALVYRVVQWLPVTFAAGVVYLAGPPIRGAAAGAPCEGERSF